MKTSASNLARRILHQPRIKRMLVNMTKRAGLYSRLKPMYDRLRNRRRANETSLTSDFGMARSPKVRYWVSSPRARRVYADLMAEVANVRKESD